MLDEEEGGTRRKEGRGGRRDEEIGATRIKERRGESRNEKVVKKKRKMKKWLEDASLTSGSCFFFFIPVSLYFLPILSCKLPYPPGSAATKLAHFIEPYFYTSSAPLTFFRVAGSFRESALLFSQNNEHL